MLSAVCMLAAVAFLLHSCNAFEQQCACTALFAFCTVTVCDSAGAPLDSVEVKVRNTLTGAYYDTSGFGSLAGRTGQYVIFSDNFVQTIHQNGEDIAVELRRDTVTDTVEYVFGSDPCRCHVQKLAGPDTVVMRTN
jgi:hypothetical protein